MVRERRYIVSYEIANSIEVMAPSKELADAIVANMDTQELVQLCDADATATHTTYSVREADD